MTETAAREIPFKVTDPARIPARRYYDEAFYKLENEKLWTSTWQMACRVEQIAEVGDWMEYSILGRSVIVTRTKDGVRAYHNACRHRGVQLVPSGTYGNAQALGFICPFHGWRWNGEGKNTFVYGRHLFDESLLGESDLKLPECRAEEALGCVFINFDDEALPLGESWGPILGALEKRLHADQRAEWWYSTEIPANWKIAMEAFMEGYHVMRTHPQLQQAVPGMYNSMYGFDTGGIGADVDPTWTKEQHVASQIKNLELLSEGMAGMVHAKEVALARLVPADGLPDDPQQMLMHWFGAVQHTIVEGLKAQGENVPDLNALAVSDPVHAVEFLFPHYFLLPFFTSTSAYRIRPTGPETCVFDIWSLTHFAPGQEPEPVMEPTVLPYDSDQFPPIPQQDYSNIPVQQKGLHAPGFEFMRLSNQKEGLISNYNRIIDGYLGDVPREKLAKAQHTLGGNFDGPFFDYDF